MIRYRSDLVQKFFCITFCIIIFAFGPLVPNGNATTGFSIMSGDLSLNVQSGWNYYDGGDAPEGAYMGWLRSGVTSRDGTIILRETLQPGRYYVSLKVIDYAESGSIRVSCGGGMVTMQPDNRDFNRYWTITGTIDVTSATNSMKITLLKTLPIDNVQKYLMIGVYITSVPDQIVDRYDRIINLAYPTEMDDSPAVKGNIVENSSFEVGTGHGWGLNLTYRDFSVKSLWDNTVSYHGKASLKVAPSREVISKVYRLKPNRKYTLSAWVKTTYPTGLDLIIENAFEPLDGYPPPTVLSKSFPIDTDWQRVSLTGYLLDYPTSDYRIKIFVHGATGNYTWIDAIQLEEGALSDYDTKRPLEIGLQDDRVSNIFFEDETISMNLMAYNNSAQEISSTVQYDIYDFMNRTVGQGAVNVTAPPENVSVSSLNLSTGKRGIFRVVLSVNNIDGTEEEVVYSVLPRPSNMGPDENSLIGIHSNYTDFQLEALQKMGIKWTRAMSPGAFFRWSIIEPNEGKFVWYDEEIQNAAAHGITVMGTIGTNNYWPQWADNGGLPDLAKWENFVEQIVNHYKDRVKYWEIWNEPIFNFTTEFYAQLLQRAASAIRRADPQAKIIGMGGVHSKDWILEVIGYLGADWTSYMDYISTHLYPPNSDPKSGNHGEAAADFKNSIVDPYSMPVWNTETGVWDQGFYKGSNSNFTDFGGTILPHTNGERYYRGTAYESERVVYNFLHSIGNGLSRYFYYDARQYASPAYLRSHPTLMEYDDTIRSKGVAYSILAHFFDHSQGLGNISPDLNTYAYLFDRGGTPLVALWAKDQTNKSISLSISGFNVYDMMGNKIDISGSTITFNRTPVYVEGQGISVDALKAAFQAGTISNRTDSLPPSLSIDTAPTGLIKDNSLRLRWIAIDDTSIPSNSNPDAIFYSYKLEGYDAAWSDWTAKTYLEYSTIPNGTYTFSVKAKDVQGNISPVVSREIILQTVSAPKNLTIIVP